MRSGRYINQPEGYKAFIPNPLPPDPLNMDWEMQDLLSKADRALGRLDGITEILPNPDLFVAMYIKQEAVLSSQIEGTQASLLDVLEFESELSRSASSDKRDVYEVINYISAFNYGLERLKTLPMSLRLMKEIHARLLQNVRGARDPGEFRRSQNWIGYAGGLLTDAAFVPPTADEMKRSMGDLEVFLYNEELHLPVLIKVGLAGVYELATNKSLQTLHHKDFMLRKCITLLTHIDLCSAHPASSFARVPSWSGRRIPGLSWMLPAWDRQ